MCACVCVCVCVCVYSSPVVCCVGVFVSIPSHGRTERTLPPVYTHTHTHTHTHTRIHTHTDTRIHTHTMTHAWGTHTDGCAYKHRWLHTTRMCVCVPIGLTEHTDRGLARVGLTNQDRTKQGYRGRCVCVCVCVCAHVTTHVGFCVPFDTLTSTSALSTCNA